MTFTDWLDRQADRDDPIGDLASDVRRDKKAPKGDAEALRTHMTFRGASSEALDALMLAEREWRHETRHERTLREMSEMIWQVSRSPSDETLKALPAAALAGADALALLPRIMALLELCGRQLDGSRIDTKPISLNEKNTLVGEIAALKADVARAMGAAK